MTTPIPLLTISPAGAADAYARTAEGPGGVGAASGNGFGAALGRALQGSIDAGSIEGGSRGLPGSIDLAMPPK